MSRIDPFVLVLSAACGIIFGGLLMIIQPWVERPCRESVRAPTENGEVFCTDPRHAMNFNVHNPLFECLCPLGGGK